jgi:predicted lipoprotein with Yx(FWY)xxD motif
MKLEHPGDTALSQEDSGNWVYKSFPGLTHLYIYDADGLSVSHCTEGCASAWPPLLATIGKTGEKVGDWTVIARDDGARQWAYKGHPVYTRFHDLQEDPQSLAAEGFHLLTP